MPQTSDQFSSLVDLDPVLTEIFYQDYEQFNPILRPLIYHVIEGQKAKETFKKLGSFGNPQEFDGQVSYTRSDDDYQIQMVIKHFTLGFMVEQTLFEDNQYADIYEDASELGQSFGRFRLEEEAAVFENAFTAGATVGYDGVALCSASHPYSKSDTTNTDSNYVGAKALTDTNLRAAVKQLRNLKDDIGKKVNLMPTHLIAGIDLYDTVEELTTSILSPETGNNAVNVHAGLTGVIHPYITGNKWFVIDAMKARKRLKWINRFANAQFASDIDNSSDLMRKYVGRDRFAYGWTDWRWLVGSNPS